MQSLIAPTPGQIWLKACNLVLNKGGEVHDGELLLKEVVDLFIEVENANDIDPIVKKYGDPEMIDWMVNNNFYGTEPVLNWGYCYGMRLRDFNGINQIDKIVEKLQKNPESKSATITTMKPEVDFEGHMPCIMSLDFKIRQDKLLLTAFFRSQDIGKKFYADILSLGKIQNEVASKIGIASGNVKIFISSAHIYETEFEKLKGLIDSGINV
jgi:thymidylate synthase